MCFIWQVIEDELRERVERLETRQATDDASLLILNRYWNQVNNFRQGSKINGLKILVHSLIILYRSVYNSLMKISNSSSDVMTKQAVNLRSLC